MERETTGVNNVYDSYQAIKITKATGYSLASDSDTSNSLYICEENQVAGHGNTSTDTPIYCTCNNII